MEKDYGTALLVEEKMKEIFNSDNKSMFDELLDSISIFRALVLYIRKR